MAKENDGVLQQNLSNDNCSEDVDENTALQDEVKTESSPAKADISTTEGNRSNLNDLVADLLVNGNVKGAAATTGSSSGSYGEYGVRSSTAYGDVSSTNATSSTSSFSFKHFLNSSGNAPTAPTSTITSLDSAMFNPASCALPSATGGGGNKQTNTGTRPKVPPKSASSGNNAISSLIGTNSYQDGNGAGGGSKMKRSPRFSSFDSQASLAEYAGANEECNANAAVSNSKSLMHERSGFRLYAEGEASDFFASRPSTTAATAANYDGKYVPRSYSNYDMPPSASPRRRGGTNSNNASSNNKESRPNRNSSKLRLDLPLDQSSSNASQNTTSNNSNNSIASTTAEFPPAIAAALPDFVQDHWMDPPTWYSSPIHLNSPPNSPLYVEPAVSSGSNAVSALNNSINETSNTAASKMLPDFLADGPIIHSSQRLADVAAGLPSNSMDSPDESAAQISRLRMENERLLRELSENSAALNEQTRRANEMERELHLQQRDFGRARAGLAETDAEKGTSTVSSEAEVNKLRQQISELNSQLEKLRGENEVLREEGAVGGSSTKKLYTPSSSTAAAAAVSSTTTGTTRTTAGHHRSNRRSQQFSRDLLTAASTAENNLRQLLAGVDNLRQLASEMENSESRQDYDVSPDLFSEFLDDREDYEEFPPGGPAL